MLFLDASVQVTALIVLGCVLAFEPVIPEIKEIMLKLCLKNVEKPDVGASSEDNMENFEYAEFADSDNEDCSESVVVPWLLKRCLNNLGVKLDEVNNCLFKIVIKV